MPLCHCIIKTHKFHISFIHPIQLFEICVRFFFSIKSLPILCGSAQCHHWKSYTIPRCHQLNSPNPPIKIPNHIHRFVIPGHWKCWRTIHIHIHRSPGLPHQIAVDGCIAVGTDTRMTDMPHKRTRTRVEWMSEGVWANTASTLPTHYGTKCEPLTNGGGSNVRLCLHAINASNQRARRYGVAVCLTSPTIGCMPTQTGRVWICVDC